ncbi:hypothetical protein [Bauldia sp.]|uniref:hypothetical protein n=1 Tax=Bauldia sp. TaxID=2575872 RepID=UPI003BA91BD6
MRVAERLGTDFRFHWPAMPTQHTGASGRVDDVFAPEFAAAFHIGSVRDRDREAMLDDREIGSATFAAAQASQTFRENDVFLDYVGLPRFGDESEEIVEREAATVHKQIRFATPVVEATDAAADAFASRFGDARTMAIHLRLGDVGGPLARIERYGYRYLPIDHYRRAIEVFAPRFDAIVLFTNDRDAATGLTEASPKIMPSWDVFAGSRLTGVQAAFADMAMMGQCDEIFAPPASSFSRAPSIFHAKPLRSLESIFSSDEILEEWRSWRKDFITYAGDVSYIVTATNLLLSGHAKQALRLLKPVMERVGNDWVYERMLRPLYPLCLWRAGRKARAIDAAEEALSHGIENDVLLAQLYTRWARKVDPKRALAVKNEIAKLRPAGIGSLRQEIRKAPWLGQYRLKSMLRRNRR